MSVCPWVQVHKILCYYQYFAPNRVLTLRHDGADFSLRKHRSSLAVTSHIPSVKKADGSRTDGRTDFTGWFNQSNQRSERPGRAFKVVQRWLLLVSRGYCVQGELDASATGGLTWPAHANTHTQTPSFTEYCMTTLQEMNKVHVLGVIIAVSLWNFLPFLSILTPNRRLYFLKTFIYPTAGKLAATKKLCKMFSTGTLSIILESVRENEATYSH